MTQDVRQSLIAFGSVLFWAGYAVIFLRASKGFGMPSWVLPLNMLLVTIKVTWQGVLWLRSRRHCGKANGS